MMNQLEYAVRLWHERKFPAFLLKRTSMEGSKRWSQGQLKERRLPGPSSIPQRPGAGKR
jgi:hypothetical protein